jgi:hypothetical protein
MQGLKTGILGLALTSFMGNAWAEDVCARAQDLTALQAAAVQQQLVVAAFTCNDYGLYNSFVIAYQKDLQKADQTLQDFFLRLHPDSGTADYHTFKTKLANFYALRSSGNAKVFCGGALQVFHAALNEGEKNLAQFVMAQPMSAAANYDTCGERIPGGAMVAAIPPALVASEGAPAIPPAAAVPVLATPASPSDAAPNVLSAKPDSGATVAATTAIDQSGTNYSTRNTTRAAAPPPPKARTYQARDRYTSDPYAYSDSYGYSNHYGERDPYYRNPYNRYRPYDRYYYGGDPQYYYLRRR